MSSEKRPDPPVWDRAAFHRRELFLAKGHAVGALIHGGIALVGADLDLVQRAVIRGIAVMRAGDDGAFDAVVGMAIHSGFLL